MGDELNYLGNDASEAENDIDRELAAEDQLEANMDAQDSYAESPQYSVKDDLYSLFWKVVKTKDSSKVGNLNDEELGMFDISVRDCQRIALLGQTLGHPGFASFFAGQGEIVLATSLSRDMALPKLFITQNKFSSKSRGNVDNFKGSAGVPDAGVPGVAPIAGVKPKNRGGLFSRGGADK